MANGISKGIGSGLSAARDALARGLVAIGVTPNALTVIGLVITLAAAVCLGVGVARAGADVPPPWAAAGAANWWLWAAAALIILAGAADVLDGAVARHANQATPSGALLDSSLDRFSDMSLFVALAAGFAWRGNFTYTLLAALALSNAVMISYVRARAEDIIANCKVGYWERPERVSALLLSMLTYQVPAVLWLLATLPLLTAIRRITYSLRIIVDRTRTGVDASEHETKPVGQGVFRLALWRYPRNTIPWDIVTAANIAWIVAAPIATSDPLRHWLGG